MSYRYVGVKRYKRGAKWENGEPRLCTRCAYEKLDGPRSRGTRAVVVASLQYVGSKFRTPVAYCENHIPEGL